MTQNLRQNLTQGLTHNAARDLPGAQEAHTDRELLYLRGISERNAAKILALDTQSIAIRHELEQKRRGFRLLTELAVSLRHQASYEGVFVPVARRINATLNMQRTMVLTPDGEGFFKPAVLQGYPMDVQAEAVSRRVEVDAALLDPDRPVLITGADPAERLAAFREAVGIPYLIASPVFLRDGAAAAILVTGRMVEETPFLSRLGRSDVETVQAISSLLAAVLVEQRLVGELRSARDLAEKNARAKGEFLANVSHEVRTPINAILGMIRLLSEGLTTDKLRQYLNQAEHSTRLLLRVFDDILDFSSLDTGRMALRPAEFSVRGVADNVRGAVEEQARAKSLSFGMTVEPGVPEILIGDPMRVEQALLNLTSNAIKFTETGGVNIRVSALSEPGRAHLLFEVEDTGIGIREEDKENLFLPFSQADASYTRKYGGTGLGLAICKTLVELMGGEIWCENRPGGGSKFAFTAPFGLPPEKTSRAAGIEAAGQGGEPIDLKTLEGMRVLLVEDNEINQLVAADILSELGVVVSIASTGLEALEALEKDTYDLILMDIQMPVMDGLTATAQIRANPKYKDLPILALTAHALPEDREASLKSGMNDHLTKPIEPEAIYAALTQWDRRPL